MRISTRSVAASLVLVGLLTPDAARCGSFSDALSDTPIQRKIAEGLARSIGRGLPVLAASPGVTYEFDLETGVFERNASILGQLFLERPDTIGKKRANISLSYQRVKFDTFQGKDLDSLSDTRPFASTTGPPFTVPNIRIELDTYETTVSATYGITDDLEFNLTLPVVYSEFDFNITIAALGSEEPFPRNPPSELGVGDLFLRGKYRLLVSSWARAALGLGLRIPTGNEDNFQGTGAVEVTPLLHVSHDPFPLGPHLRLQPYISGGVNFDADDVDGSEGRWGVGLDCAVRDRLTIAIAVLGRHAFSRLGPPGLFDFDRVDGSSAPLFGWDSDRPDFYDLSVGGRLRLWRDTIMAFGNVILPLNDDGFRADLIPLFGLEAAL